MGQWALAHLVLKPEFDVPAVVTTHTRWGKAGYGKGGTDWNGPLG